MAALNQNLQKLFKIAQKEEKTGIGLMSGTSLDGLDIALCRFESNGPGTKFALLNFTTIPYNEDFKKEVQSVFARRDASLQKVCLLNAYTGSFHGGLVLKALKTWGVSAAEVDFIASHGQTIYHAPKWLHGFKTYPNATLQIGDGDHLAVKTGIMTISDFRQKPIAAGGEGAPLALYGDVLLGSKAGENRVLLNIGGIANLTFLPANGNLSEVLCTDIGPGNTLIDAACREYFGLPYDEDSKIAFSGNVYERLLNTLLNHPFFKEHLPKTTGPELFSSDYIAKAKEACSIPEIAPNDLVATLSVFSAKCIVDFILDNIMIDDLHIFLSGGGAKNKYIVSYLRRNLPGIEITDTNVLGIDPDAKEAILFALLGNEALCGEPIKIGGNPAVLMGKFSFPI